MPIQSMGICHIGDGRSGGQSPTMIEDHIKDRLEAEIRLQKREMKELSLASGLGETYVRDALRRGRGKLEHLFKVAAELGKTREWLLGQSIETTGESAAPRVRPNASGREPAPSYGPPLDVLGASKGGDDGKLIYNGQVIERIPRPPILEDVEDAYATYVTGTSMRPRFKEGEKVWVHPHKPARPGDDVVVQVYPEHDGDAPEGFIKEFVRFAGKKLVLYQHNPPGEFELDRVTVKSVHVIVGSLYA